MSFGFPSGGLHIPYLGHMGPGDYQNEADQEIIGVKDALLFWYSNYGMGTSSVAGGGFTATVFDTSAYSDGAIVKLNNNSGGDRKIGSCAIHAKPVVRYSGEKGIKHDDFVDYESILRDGENKLEFGNNYIVNTSQLESLCDHYWKANNYKRHVYQLEIPGRCYWYAPGEWYTVQIGGAGQAEYIDSVCECYDVQVECEAGGLGRTVVAFREVYENWTKDSGALARFLGSGSPKDKYNFSHVLVASQYFPGPSDYRCDGTDDQTEIQAAIDQIAGAGGGVVELTEGTFDITATINMSYDNVVLRGAGKQTILSVSDCYESYGLKIEGSSGNEIERPILSNFAITQSDALPTYALIFLYYCDNAILDSLYCYDAAVYDNTLAYLSDNLRMVNCTINGATRYGAQFRYCVSAQISGCTLDSNGNGIYIADLGQRSVISQCIISNNHRIGIYGKIDQATITGNVVTGNGMSGIRITGDKNVISGNIVNDNTSPNTMYAYPTGTANTASGIYMDSTSERNIVRDNNCVDNGNIITAADCESTTKPYITSDAASLSGCTAARSTAQYYAGSYSYKITQTDASTGEYRFCDNVTKNDMHGLYAGTQYKLSVRTYLLATGSPTTAEVKLIVGYTTDAAGAWHETTGNVTTDHDAWGLAETTNVAIPSGAVGAKALVRINAAASTDEYIFIDNVRLQPIGTHNLHSQNFYDAGTATYVGV